MPLTLDLSFTGLDEFANKPIVENYKAKSSEEEPKGNPQIDLQDQGVIDSRCSRHMTRNMSYLTDYKEIDEGYVAFKGNLKEGKSQEKLPLKLNINFKFYETIGCLVTILNTLDHLGKFDGKADEGFFIGYSLNSKSFRVFNSRTRIMVENLHIRFSESTPNIVDIKLAFVFEKIEEEVYVCQPPGFKDPDFLDRVYNIEKALYGLHQAPRPCQDKYVAEILKKFGFTIVKTTSTPMETQNPLLNDEDGEEMDVHVYRSMIGSLMYLTSSRPDIMFAAYALYTDSDYAGASLDRKFTTRGCQFHGCRLISWQCKKQTVVENSTTEAEYVVASSCYGQVLWIQNQLLDYGKFGEDSFQQGKIEAIDADEDIILVNDQVEADKDMFDVNVLGGEEVFVVAGQNENIVNITTKELTLAQAHEALKTSKPKVKEIAIQEHEELERLLREKYQKEQEANVALIETWDDIQAKIDVDHQLAERMQAQEKKELSDAKKATLFQQLLEKRRKHFVAKRADEKRNKPPTQAQKRKIMCTYLKNMKGYKLKDLKLKEFDKIQEIFDRAFRRVNTFEDFRPESVERKEKRVEEELIQDSTKKQKVEDNKETTELKQLMEIIPDKEEVAIDAIPLVVKS
nr:hypothetical protein [Tanacetum cinerariifolium]